jgi:hypothetical protein
LFDLECNVRKRADGGQRGQEHTGEYLARIIHEPAGAQPDSLLPQRATQVQPQIAPSAAAWLLASSLHELRE